MTEELQSLVKKKADELMEHFDSVRIFVTKHEGATDETKSFEAGAGNFYAQYGQVTEWVSLQDQFQRNEAIRRDSK